MDLFGRYMTLDQALQNYIKEFLHVQQKYAHLNISPTSEAEKFWDTVSSESIFMSGSAVEVGNICRTLGSNRIEIEFDSMIERGILQKEYERDFLIPIEGHSGFFHCRRDMKENRRYVADVVYKIYTDAGKYIKMPSHAANFKNRIDAFFMQPWLIEEDIVDTSNMIVKRGEGRDRDMQKAGPSSALTYNYIRQFISMGYSNRIVETAYEICGEWSCDTVPCIKLCFLPECCDDWYKKPSYKGLSKELVNEVTKLGCHLVGKDVEGYQNTFRVSFSAAERYLFATMPHNARLVYLAAKSIFYVHIKDTKWCENIEFKTLPSYCIKTVMLYYYAEKEPSFWETIATDKDFEKCLAEIYEMFYQNLKLKDLRNFFVPNVNIFEGLEILDSYYTNMLDLVYAIMCHPRSFYPQHIGGTEQLVKLHEILAEVRIGRLKLLLKYGDDAKHAGFLREHREMVNVADMKLYDTQYEDLANLVNSLSVHEYNQVLSERKLKPIVCC